jgi:hypothetical protein
MPMVHFAGADPVAGAGGNSYHIFAETHSFGKRGGVNLIGDIVAVLRSAKIPGGVVTAEIVSGGFADAGPVARMYFAAVKARPRHRSNSEPRDYSALPTAPSVRLITPGSTCAPIAYSISFNQLQVSDQRSDALRGTHESTRVPRRNNLSLANLTAEAAEWDVAWARA